LRRAQLTEESRQVIYCLVFERSGTDASSERRDRCTSQGPKGRDVDAIILAELDEPLLRPVHVALDLVDGRLDGGSVKEAFHLGRGEVGDPFTRFMRDGLVVVLSERDCAKMGKQEIGTAI
jgi:hypothetical protein